MTSIALLAICWAICFVIAFAILPAWRRSHDTGKEFRARTVDQNKAIVTAALKELNCKCNWTTDRGDTVVKYDYQSGHFCIRLEQNSPYVKLAYLFFFVTPLENLELVRNLCNQCNINSETCRVVYSTNNDRGSVEVHIVAGLWLNERTARDILERAMGNVFSWQNIFVKRFKELQETNAHSERRDLEADQAHWERELYLIREQELMHQAAGPGWRETEREKITLRRVLAVMMGLKDIRLKQLSVISDETVTEIDPETALDYDLATALIQEGDFKHRQALLNLSFDDPGLPSKERQMTIHLKAEKRSRHSLYYRISLMLVPLSAQKTVPLGSIGNVVQSHSLLVAYDLHSATQLEDEFRYMWKEAMEKAKAGDRDSMTDEQRLICDCIDPQLAANLYRGRTLLEQDRCIEALRCLENAFDTMSLRISHPMSAADRNKFGEVAYLIGFCYNELRLYRQAYYYLELTLPFHRVNYTEEYINCLVNGGDFRAASIIDELIVEIENVHSADGSSQWQLNVRPFLNFLKRRKAYVCISQQRYDEAEKLLKKMLDDPDNSDFALNELAYIQKMKGEN